MRVGAVAVIVMHGAAWTVPRPDGTHPEGASDSYGSLSREWAWAMDRPTTGVRRTHDHHGVGEDTRSRDTPDFANRRRAARGDPAVLVAVESRSAARTRAPTRRTRQSIFTSDAERGSPGGRSGAAAAPSPERNVQRCVGWLTHLEGVSRPSAPSTLGRRYPITRARRKPGRSQVVIAAVWQRLFKLPGGTRCADGGST